MADAATVKQPLTMKALGLSMRFVDLTGKKYGTLTVLGMSGVVVSTFRDRLWECICDCGQSKIIRENLLKFQKRPTCGTHQKNCVLAHG